MAKNISKAKIACAYIRVSTDKQEELSPDAQKRLVIDYAKKNNMLLTNDNIYVENGISGKKADKRPEFMKMIGMAKSKEHPYDFFMATYNALPGDTILLKEGVYDDYSYRMSFMEVVLRVIILLLNLRFLVLELFLIFIK